MLESDKEVYSFRQNGENFVLDPNSQLFWNIQSKFADDSGTLQTYYNKLFSYGFFQNNIQLKDHLPVSKFDLSNLVINPSSNCNLECWFCYSKHYKKENYNVLSLEEIKSIIKKALEFKIQTQSNSPLSISMFFTSEISLEFKSFLDIWHYVEKIKNNYQFPIYMFLPPTNLMEVSNDFVEFVEKYGYLTVSLDLLNEVQRSKALHNLKRFQKTVRKHCIIPVNSNNSEFLEIYTKLLDHFEYISMRPVRIPHDSLYPWTQEALELFSDEMQSFVCNLLDLNNDELLQLLLAFGPSDYFARYIDRIISRVRLSDRCPAGRRAVAVNLDSKLYPCSGFFDNDQYSFDSFDELLDEETNGILSSNIYSRHICKKCPIRFYCGGPCEDWKSKMNNYSVDSVNQIECSINFIYFKNAIYFITELYDKNPEILSKYTKEKGIENRLSYPLNFEDFVLFFS